MNSRTPPVKGGQGRDEDEVICDGLVVGLCIIGIVGFFTGLLIGIFSPW